MTSITLHILAHALLKRGFDYPSLSAGELLSSILVSHALRSELDSLDAHAAARVMSGVERQYQAELAARLSAAFGGASYPQIAVLSFEPQY